MLDECGFDVYISRMKVFEEREDDPLAIAAEEQRLEFYAVLEEIREHGSNLKRFIGEREILALSITFSNRFSPCRSRNQRQRSSKQRITVKPGEGGGSEEEWERKIV